ncbi:unnamed protein product, partial [Prorocentrum cordatum]
AQRPRPPPGHCAARRARPRGAVRPGGDAARGGRGPGPREAGPQAEDPKEPLQLPVAPGADAGGSLGRRRGLGADMAATISYGYGMSSSSSAPQLSWRPGRRSNGGAAPARLGDQMAFGGFWRSLEVNGGLLVDALQSTEAWLTGLAQEGALAGERAQPIVRTALEAMFVLGHLFAPLAPSASHAIIGRFADPPRRLDELRGFGCLAPGGAVLSGSVLFKPLEPGEAAAAGAVGDAPPGAQRPKARASKSGGAINKQWEHQPCPEGRGYPDGLALYLAALSASSSACRHPPPCPPRPHPFSLFVWG